MRETLNNFKRLLAFYPLADEPPVHDIYGNLPLALYLPVLEAQKIVFRLYKQPDQPAVPLQKGRFGISEPIGSPEAGAVLGSDLLLAPSLGCNSEGARLGRGGGFYDRSKESLQAACKLSLLPESCCNINFRSEPHDMLLDLIITENKCIEL